MDIVEWLREKAKGFFKPTSTRLKEAADEIERLQEEHHNVRILNEQYYNENAILTDEIERLREALLMWDYLIEHQYNGSREAMSDMMYAAQYTARLLYGDPPWPNPPPRPSTKGQ